MQVVLRVEGKPDFTPDHLDLEAPPPPGTTVECGGARYTVQELTLHVRPGLNGVWRTFYAVSLSPWGVGLG